MIIKYKTNDVELDKYCEIILKEVNDLKQAVINNNFEYIMEECTAIVLGKRVNRTDYTQAIGKIFKYFVLNCEYSPIVLEPNSFTYTDLVSIDLHGLVEPVIPSSCFHGCEDLTEVIFPDNLHGIGFNSFSGCSSLKKVKLPKGLKKLADYCFSNCKNLKDINIPNSVGYVGEGIFFNSRQVGRVIPSDIKFICSGNGQNLK